MKFATTLALLALTCGGLAACDRPAPPATVAVPVPVPGPAGPAGEPGKPGDTSIVVVPVPVPAASEAK